MVQSVRLDIHDREITINTSRSFFSAGDESKNSNRTGADRRDINNNGFISYASSLRLGTTIAFFSSIILAFYSVIFISYIDTEALSEIIKLTEQTMLEAQPEISDEELDLALQMVSKFMQPHWMMIMGMLGGTFMGFLYSLIISICVKKEDPNLIA